MARIERATSPLPRECSTTEPHGRYVQCIGFGAGEGNRTLVISLEGFCSTIELHPPWNALRTSLESSPGKLFSTQPPKLRRIRPTQPLAGPLIRFVFVPRAAVLNPCSKQGLVEEVGFEPT